MKEIVNYKNGNVQIQLFEDGTRVMEYDETQPVVFDFPTSMDIKITNYCDGTCEFCHEKSNKKGKHADWVALLDILDSLPGGQEIAIGGGNPLDHPKLALILYNCKQKNFLPSLTVNFQHLNSHFDKLNLLIREKLIYGLGISIPTNGIQKFTEDEKYFLQYPHTVAHLIIGLHKPDIINDLRNTFGLKKFLLLGYKEFGRGIQYYKKFSSDIENNIQIWNKNVIQILMGNNIISFDNLSIEQLDMQKKLPKEIWEKNYQFDDFTSTMYIDAVEQVFAPTSRSDERVKWSEITLLDYFRTYSNKVPF